MFIEVVWILVTAATGSCSTSCQSDTILNVCSLDPYIGSGQRNAWDFFYDWRTDKCLPMYFGYSGKDYGEENRFFSEKDCNSQCRKGVKNECFELPVNAVERGGIEKWTYNDTFSKCVRFRWQRGWRKDTNTFDSERECIKKCRKPDLGLCAYKFQTECKHGDDLYIWYNNATQECQILPPHHCPTYGNAFYTFRQCYQRCGRFVENKCKLPIQNMSFCGTAQSRYGYNTKTKRCEKFLGCEDSGNNFPTAKACWETCANNTGNPCVQEPDYVVSGWIFWNERYYYDIKSHTCVKKKLLRGLVTGKSNLFNNIKECTKACMATYIPEPDWL
ncbi:unnamed protein product [Ixodes pacificus]